MSEKLSPRKSPCATCPYRLDVPSGVWDEEEYAKLPAYDRPTGEQPVRVFMCHQQDGKLCAGWCAVHAEESLALRLGVSFGKVDPSAINYQTTVPLHPSGTAAAEHGMKDYTNPPEKAREAITKIVRKQSMT